MAATGGQQEVEPAYGSPDFQSASELVRELGASRGRPTRLVRTLLLQPRELARAVLTVARLPVLELAVSDGPNGRAIRAELDETKAGIPVGRLARAALPLPTDFRVYMRGRSRQALRTNLKHATELGVVCRPLDDADERKARARELAGVTGSDASLYLPGAERREYYLAEHAGETLAIAVLVVDVEFAYLAFMVSPGGSRPCSYARYALSAYLIEKLVQRRIRALVVHGKTLWIRSGLQYFQHRLGFRPHNIKVKTLPRQLGATSRTGPDARTVAPEREPA